MSNSESHHDGQSRRQSNSQKLQAKSEQNDQKNKKCWEVISGNLLSWRNFFYNYLQCFQVYSEEQISQVDLSLHNHQSESSFPSKTEAETDQSSNQKEYPVESYEIEDKEKLVIIKRSMENFQESYQDRIEHFGYSMEEVQEAYHKKIEESAKNFREEFRRWICCYGGNEIQHLQQKYKNGNDFIGDLGLMQSTIEKNNDSERENAELVEEPQNIFDRDLFEKLQQTNPNLSKLRTGKTSKSHRRRKRSAEDYLENHHKVKPLSPQNQDIKGPVEYSSDDQSNANNFVRMQIVKIGDTNQISESQGNEPEISKQTQNKKQPDLIIQNEEIQKQRTLNKKIKSQRQERGSNRFSVKSTQNANVKTMKQKRNRWRKYGEKEVKIKERFANSDEEEIETRERKGLASGAKIVLGSIDQILRGGEKKRAKRRLSDVESQNDSVIIYEGSNIVQSGQFQNPRKLRDRKRNSIEKGKKDQNYEEATMKIQSL